MSQPADGDDERTAQLFQSLTDADDTERRDLARPLLIAAGDQLAADAKCCLIPGVRPLLEYLFEVAAPTHRSLGRHQLGAPGHRARPSR